MKSNSLIMMYNLIESTIKQTIFHIYESVNFDKIPFQGLSDDYKKLFEKYNFRGKEGNQLTNRNKIIEASNLLVENILNKEEINFENDKFKLSGNADLKKAKQIYSTHGINIKNDKNLPDCGFALLFIKNSRNGLAHGSETFSEVGRTKTVDDICEYSEVVIDFLEYLIKKTNVFIQHKRYKQ
ncbi:MAE_28990/MAE_18760 family HEPN-like nuclease [Liquorilactobacillus satsumensis]|uniref:MAE_28990/MAE_18760 family HEPN-like nuclease n=1 Tax=Liquorilactobacillus satsumensis TaxID=259059 RepID=UPI0036F3E465